MANSSQNPSTLIEEVISFIKKERELYGDFSMRDSLTRKSSKPEAEKPESNKISEPEDEVYDGNQIYREIEKCQNLEELKALCEKADVLKTDLKNTKMVFGDGNPNADLMLIGEAPGAEEDKQGEPFVGSAGKMLNQILEAINFKRDDIYISNILKHRPPNNRDPLPEERKRSLPFLLKQIELIDPKLILALGKVSAQTLLDTNASLTKMRGKFHNFRGKYELLATFHPAALLYRRKWKRPTWEDVQLLRKRYDELGGKP
ncbi:MAG TPA: uracil-DNA glycosylase [Balneolaceae bacterium]